MLDTRDVVNMYLLRFQRDNRKLYLLMKICNIIDAGGKELDELERLVKDIDGTAIIKTMTFQSTMKTGESDPLADAIRRICQ